MSDDRGRAVAQVLDSETFERLPNCHEQSTEPVELIDSETLEPLHTPAPVCGLAERLRALVQRAFEAEARFYNRVFELPDGVF